MLQPIDDPNEMDLAVAEAAARVNLSPREIAHALATYLRSIMSGNSPYDRYANGDRAALSAEGEAGLRIFRGKGNCTACHVGPSLSDERFHNTGIAWATAAGSAGGFMDEGRGAITGKAEDRRSNTLWITTIAAATGTPGSIPSCGHSDSVTRRRRPWSRSSSRCPPRPVRRQGEELEARAYTGPASKLLPK